MDGALGPQHGVAVHQGVAHVEGHAAAPRPARGSGAVLRSRSRRRRARPSMRGGIEGPGPRRAGRRGTCRCARRGRPRCRAGRGGPPRAARPACARRPRSELVVGLPAVRRARCGRPPPGRGTRGPACRAPPSAGARRPAPRPASAGSVLESKTWFLKRSHSARRRKYSSSPGGRRHGEGGRVRAPVNAPPGLARRAG